MNANPNTNRYYSNDDDAAAISLMPVWRTSHGPVLRALLVGDAPSAVEVAAGRVQVVHQEPDVPEPALLPLLLVVAVMVPAERWRIRLAGVVIRCEWRERGRGRGRRRGYRT